MSEEETPKQPPKSDFLAADEIRAILLGRDTDEQERIIRWVVESLGLTLHVRPKATHSHAEEPVHESPRRDEPSEPPEAVRSRDIRSFVQEKQPKSDVQFAVAVAYYHRFIAAERKPAITTEDLQEGARHSNRPVFKIPSTTLSNAVQQGYLDRGARGEYRINAVGENLVAMTLPGASAESSGKGGARGRPRAATKAKAKTKARSSKTKSAVK